MTIDSLKKIAVVGAGTMGQGIAQLCATAGYQVMLYDAEFNAADAAVSTIKKNLDSAVVKNKLTSEQHGSILSRISVISNFNQLQADLIIEAIVEQLDAKRKLFSSLEDINSNYTVLASNTSSISITQIASALKRPDRFAGLHFFNPATLMKLVEIIKGTNTNSTTIDLLKKFSKSVNKISVVATDSPGFIVNRVARHFYIESLSLLEESCADIQGIDRLLRSSGFKMGPFELMDLIGIDVNFSVTSSLYKAFHQQPKFRPSWIQQQKVDARLLGRKTGKGFYEYP